MSLKTLVTTKATGTFGTFEVKDGNVTKNGHPILQFFNGTTALVPMTARASFTTPDEHAAFDEALMGLAVASASIQYVDSIAKFMDPKARFKEFIEGKLAPASVGLKLTDEELAIPTSYNSAKAKFIAMFTPPTPPRKLDERPVTESQKLTIKVRQGKPYQISNGSYTMSVTAAKTLWDSHLSAKWAKRDAVRSSNYISQVSTSASGYTNRTATIYPTEISIGCQTIQRNAIEAIAQQLGWDM